MSLIRLANVLLEDTAQFYRVPALYCRFNAPVVPTRGGAWELRGPGVFDFSTYFNCLSIAKFRRYTVARSFMLHLELRGAAFTVVPTSGNSFSVNPIRHEAISVQHIASEDWVQIDLALDYAAGEVVAGFIIEAEGPVEIRDSAYYADADEALVRPVELALATTTFKKESYILNNLRRLEECILKSDEDISGHFQIHVIDNGRTLAAEDVEGLQVHLHPNANVGGSGGFACGMISAMEQTPEATHVLLMDDDVVVSPESVIRTYNLLRLVKNEYKGALVSGTMMENENPSLCFEDYAFWTNGGECYCAKPRVNAEVFLDCVLRESVELHPNIDGYEDQSQTYAAWWFCAIPMDVIKENGLPLPLFVRLDDVEYGLRCACPIMTMNGICLWHDAFAFRYNFVQERYQTIRNALIMSSTTGVAGKSYILETNEDGRSLAKNFIERDLRVYDYDAAALIIQAIEDFFEGPEAVLTPGFGEKRFIGLNREFRKQLPLDEIKAVLHRDYGIDLPDFTACDVEIDVPWDQEEAGYYFATLNCQLPQADESDDHSVSRFKRVFASGAKKDCETRPPKIKIADTIEPFMGVSSDGSLRWAIIDHRGGAEQCAKAYDRDLLIAIDVSTGRASLRLRDRARCKELWDRFNADLDRMEREGDEIRMSYAAVRSQATSLEFWKKYLGSCLAMTSGRSNC